MRVLSVVALLALALACRGLRQFLVIVLTHDRPDGLQRLLEGLSKADYTGAREVDIKIRIDRRTDGGVDGSVVSLAERLHWRHGRKLVHVTEANENIVGQWLNGTAGVLDEYERFIVIEDDIEVDSLYFQWLVASIRRYSDFARLAGITLHRDHTNAVVDERKHSIGIPRRFPVYLYRHPSSWAMSPTPRVWREFLAWAHAAYARNGGISPVAPGLESTYYYRSHIAEGRTQSMWSMWFIHYCHEHGLYTLYPNYPNKGGLAINNRMKGVHFDRKYNAPETMAELPFDESRWYPAPGQTPLVGWQGLISGFV